MRLSASDEDAPANLRRDCILSIRVRESAQTFLGAKVTEDVRWTDSRIPDANQHLALAHLLHKLRSVQPPEVRHTLNMAQCLPVGAMDEPARQVYVALSGDPLERREVPCRLWRFEVLLILVRDTERKGLGQLERWGKQKRCVNGPWPAATLGSVARQTAPSWSPCRRPRSSTRGSELPSRCFGGSGTVRARESRQIRLSVRADSSVRGA